MVVVQNILEDVDLQLGEKWAYDPHHIISNTRVEKAYDPYVHEPQPNVEKIANGGQTKLSGGMEVELPIQEKRISKEAMKMLLI